MTERSIPTVYVIDDDASIRESVTFLLESAGLRVRAFESCEAFLGVEPEAGPGCILLDLRLPAMSGLELQRALVERGERLPIIFITGHGDTASAVRAMKAGAIDFLEKPYAPETLLDAVERAVRMDGAEQARQADRARVSALMDRLSDRERDVLAHVVQGLRSQDIADRLGISRRTVESHRNNIMKKLRTRNVAELVRLATIAGSDALNDQGSAAAR